MRSYERRVIGAANADAQVELIHRLREIRQSKAIQVSEVAEAMGVDVAMVYRFEKGGTNFTAATLRKYAKAVGALLRLDAVDASSAPELQESRSVESESDSWEASPGSHVSIITRRSASHASTTVELPAAPSSPLDNWHANVNRAGKSRSFNRNMEGAGTS